MRRKRVIGLSAVVLTVLAVIVATISSCSATPQSAKPTTQATSSPAGPPLSAARAQQIADALRSGDTGRVKAAIAMPSGQPVPTGFVQQLHSLRSLNAVPASVHNNGDGTASATYIMVDSFGKTSTWRVTLIEPNGIWLFGVTTLEQ